MGAGANVDAAAAAFVSLANPLGTIDDAGGGEIRSGDMLHQTRHVDGGVIDVSDASVDNFVEIVRRNVRGHAHGDTRRTVDQQIGETGWKYAGFSLGFVVVRREIDGLLVDVGEHLVGDARHPHLGVTHGGRRVAVHGSEVALTVYEHDAHGERLRHPHQRIVDRRFAVGVVLTYGVTDHPGGLLIGLVPVVPELAQCRGNGFKSVDRIRCCSSPCQRNPERFKSLGCHSHVPGASAVSFASGFRVSHDQDLF